MKHLSFKKIILSALFMVLTFCTTFIIQIEIPMTNGYLNLGDCMVLICGFILGPYYGGFAAGIGSAVTDLISGYAIYAFPTFIIKFLMAFVVGLNFRFFKKSTLWVIICGVIGEAVMILGYFIFEAYIIGLGWSIALTSATANVFQAITGICASTLLLQAFMDKKEKPQPNETFDDYDEDYE